MFNIYHWRNDSTKLLSRKVRISVYIKKSGSLAQLTSILLLMYDLFLFVGLKN